MSKILNRFWVSPVLFPQQPWAPQRKSFSQTSLKTQPLSAGRHPLPRWRASGLPLYPLQEVGHLGRGEGGRSGGFGWNSEETLIIPSSQTSWPKKTASLQLRSSGETSFVESYETLGRNYFVKGHVMKIVARLIVLKFYELQIPNNVFTQ